MKIYIALFCMLLSSISQAQVVCNWANMKYDPCDMSEHPQMKAYNQLNGKVKKLEEYEVLHDGELIKQNKGDTTHLVNTVTFYPSGLMKTYHDPSYYSGYHTVFEYDKKNRLISEKQISKNKVISLYLVVYTDAFDQALVNQSKKKVKANTTISDVKIIALLPGNKDATIETTIRVFKYRHGRQVSVETDTLTQFVKFDQKTGNKSYFGGHLNPRKIESVSADGQQGYKMVSDLKEPYLREKVDAKGNILYFHNGCEVYSTYDKYGRKTQDSIVSGGHTTGGIIRYEYHQQKVNVTYTLEEQPADLITYKIDKHGNWTEMWGALDYNSKKPHLLQYRKITYFD